MTATQETSVEGIQLVDRILEQLEPLIARQRRAIAEQGCFRQISSTHLHVLYLLVSDGPLPMGRLADQLDVSLPNVTGIVERMVEKGLVERIRQSDDRRVVEVAATHRGRQVVDEIDLIKRSQLASVVSRLDDDQQHRALRTFTEMRAAAEELDAQEQRTLTNEPNQARGEAAQ